jgi:hypothetical protein
LEAIASVGCEGVAVVVEHGLASRPGWTNLLRNYT